MRNNYYRPQRSWGKVMFLQASVILLTGEVCSGGGDCLVPVGSAPGGGGGCLVETSPGRPLLRAVRILLECILVQNITCLISSSVYSGPGGGLCCGWPFCATVMHFDSLGLSLHLICQEFVHI